MRTPASWLFGIALFTSSCGAAVPGPASRADPANGELVIFAAASLSGSLDTICESFQRRHRGVHCRLNFAGTPTLVAQMRAGAAVDVFASADAGNMETAVKEGLVHGPARPFARNQLEIAVAAGNPRHIRALSDLGRPDVLFIAAAPTVPVGRYGAAALAAAGVTVHPRSEEADVRSVLGKVALGEADAGIVYVTDIRAAALKISGVQIPAAQNVVATYPVARAVDARNPAAADSFISYLLSPAAQSTLASYGFTS
ncbi:MAG: molybdate ABC transporter substrate-binding protein [Candidatus Dormibacteria bacterium]